MMERTRSLGLIAAALLMALGGRAQNLVPNPSFEELDGCPSNLSQIQSAPPWRTFRGSVDLFNFCDTIGYVDVPRNGFGFQYPFDGEGYAGLISWLPGDSLHREFLGAELNAPLVPGVAVYLSFRLAVGGWGLFAPQPDQSSSGVGVFFSTAPFVQLNGVDPLPQWTAISLETAPTDTAVWILVSGVFIPDSAYTQIIIGNPLYPSEMEVVLLDSSSIGNAGAYVFLDGICASLSPGFCPMVMSGSDDSNWENLKWGPNPCSEKIWLFANEESSRPDRYELYDMRGVLVDEGKLTWLGGQSVIGTLGWPEGIFSLLTYTQTEPIFRTTVVHVNP